MRSSCHQGETPRVASRSAQTSTETFAQIVGGSSLYCGEVRSSLGGHIGDMCILRNIHSLPQSPPYLLRVSFFNVLG